MKKILITSILLVTYLLGATHPTSLNNTIAAMMEDLEIPGMAIAISKKGETIYSESFGYADLKKDKIVNSETLFRMASVSKLLAAGAIA